MKNNVTCRTLGEFYHWLSIESKKGLKITDNVTITIINEAVIYSSPLAVLNVHGIKKISN